MILNNLFKLVGVNLRTGRQGIFPSAYAVDMEYNDFDPSNVQAKRERYLLGFVNSFLNLVIRMLIIIYILDT